MTRGSGGEAVLSGPERRDPLQAATTEPESLSTSIEAADRLAKAFLRPEESGWGRTERRFRARCKPGDPPSGASICVAGVLGASSGLLCAFGPAGDR
jgi:hypothetical protein